MEHTFITIHDLSEHANILFVSDSITDILGWRSHEVQGKSCFDFFHRDEVAAAEKIRARSVLMNKAASLHYIRILSRSGVHVTCECCFSIVHDVLVACTSIYRRTAKSERRALDAPEVRRIFSSSSRDPRYGMLEHLSSKFSMPPPEREPRAAMILNRFTRTLSVMFSTPAVSSILGIDPEEIQHKSFYECIAPDCLPEAVRCLESAKANDSIAYLRFWFRDPRRDEDIARHDRDGSSATTDDGSSSTSDDSDGGAPIDDPMEVDMSTVSGPPGPASGRQDRSRRRRLPQIELEAVISCTSDGLVVVLRRARQALPTPQLPAQQTSYQNGLFAAPWGAEPIQPYDPPPMYTNYSSGFAPDHGPAARVSPPGGQMPMANFMQSIRDVAVFAWGLVGINNNLAQFSRGTPSGEAQPEGYPSSSTDRSRGSYWSLGSSDDAFHRMSDVSPLTSQRPSNNCSSGHSPYISDGPLATHSAESHLHASVHEASSRPSMSSAGSVHQNVNHQHQPNWSEGSSTITSMHPGGGTQPFLWHGSSNNNPNSPHHTRALPPGQPTTTTTGPSSTYPAM